MSLTVPPPGVSTTTTVRAEAEHRLVRRLNDGTARCGVLGLGFIGSTLADAVANTGLTVCGYDRSELARERFAPIGDGTRNGCAASGDPTVLDDVDVILVAVRVSPRTDGTVDTEPLDAAGALLSRLPQRPRLVLLASTVPVGATRQFATRWFDDDTVFVAHAPERLAVGHGTSDLARIPHLVGGLDEAATRVSTQFLARICRDVVPVACCEVSELSKLLENAFIGVGIALVAEVTKIAIAANVAARTVTEAAATKPFGYFPFHPGPGIGGHCIPNDLELLRHSADALGVATPLLAAASLTRREMSTVVVGRVRALLEREGLALEDAEILLVGTGFKPGSADQTGSPAADLVRELLDQAARPAYLDSDNDSFIVDRLAVPRVLPADLSARRFAAAVIVSGDRQISAELLHSSATVVLDAGGGSIVLGSHAGTAHL